MQLFKVILDTFGSAVIVPLVVFILSVCLKVRPKVAFLGALKMGIGLTAYSVILGTLLGSLGAQVTQMVESVGVNLPVIDIGWAMAASVTYANTAGMAYLILGVVLNLVLFLVKWTDTFQPTDIWNYYVFVFWAVLVQYVTGSFALAMACAVFLNLVVLLLADILAPVFQEYFGYEGVACTGLNCTAAAPFALLMKWIFKKTRLDRIQLSPESIQKRFGFLGEPMGMGIIIGGVITIVANYKHLGEMGTWATVLAVALTTGAMLTLYPMIASFFAGGLTPISETLQRRLDKGEIKRDNFFIAIDPGVFFGNGANVAAGFILVLIMVVVSIVQPGNRMIPLADIAAIPFSCICVTAITKGNIFQTIITSTIWFTIGQWCNSSIADIFTSAATAVGANEGGQLISSWYVGTVPLGWLGFKLFTIGWIGIIAAFAAYFILYFFFRRHKAAWQMAFGASREYMDAHILRAGRQRAQVGGD